MVSYTVYAERRVSAMIQDRVGPNRVGIYGLVQPIADAVKLLLKEDFTPAHVNKFYYWLAPACAMAPSMMALAVIPFRKSALGRADGSRECKRRRSLGLCCFFAGRLRHRLSRMVLELEVSVSRRNPLHLADDFLRAFARLYR